MKLRTLLVTICLAAGLSGCWTGKKRPQVPTPPLAPLAVRPPVPAPVPVVEDVPPPLAPAPARAIAIDLPPLPAVPPRRKPRARAVSKAAVPIPALPVTPPVIQPADPPPQLGELLTGERRRQYDAEFSRSMAQARAALNRVATMQAGGRALTAGNRQTLDRIRTFVQQAEESKSKDLVTALQLARRGELLAQDLLKSFQ